ncbi:MAG: outer membrane lipoprotein carrier protein LolA [Acidobacteria bacterium]|nr:outer membrane lipoprotein carrier protein LolA [Acidobacteriota bacterium]
MSKLKRYLGFAALLFVFIGGAAASEASGQVLNSILTRMDNHNKALRSLRADVTMVKENTQLRVNDTTEGKVLYVPQRNSDPLVRIDWRSPDETFAVVKGTYIIYRPRLQQYITGSTKQAKGKGTAGGALAFMNMSRAELRKNYEVVIVSENASLSGGVSTIHLKLTPKIKTSYQYAEVWVDSDGMPLQSKVVENNGDSTTILLKNLEKNITIDRSTFQVKLPPGTKRVDA